VSAPLAVALLVAALGLAGFVGTMLAMSVWEWVREHRAVARGTLPGMVRFTARRRRSYSVWLLLDDARDPAAAVDATRCAVSTGAWLRGDDQSIAARSDRVASVGMFAAPAGTVELSASGPAGMRYFVAPAERAPLRGPLVAIISLSTFYFGLALTALALIDRFIL
jgi:hypothetical protein